MSWFSCFGQESKELLGTQQAYLKFKACLVHEAPCENLSKLVYGTEENPWGGKHRVRRAPSCSLQHFHPREKQSKANLVLATDDLQIDQGPQENNDRARLQRTLKVSVWNGLQAPFKAASQCSPRGQSWDKPGLPKDAEQGSALCHAAPDPKSMQCFSICTEQGRAFLVRYEDLVELTIMVRMMIYFIYRFKNPEGPLLEHMYFVHFTSIQKHLSCARIYKALAQVLL